MNINLKQGDIKFIKMELSRISVIGGHNRYTKTDQLYDPLRKTFLLDTTAKKTYLDDVSRVSHLSHIAQTHNYIENHDLGQKTLIPENVELFRTDDLSRLPKNTHYTIINAQERQFEPISQEELQQKLKCKREEVYMYTYDKEEKLTAKPVEEPIVKLEQKPQKPIGIKLITPKYNLFSIIDEPINNILSGKACTCPANELVASRRNEIYWNVDEAQRIKAVD